MIDDGFSIRKRFMTVESLFTDKVCYENKKKNYIMLQTFLIS